MYSARYITYSIMDVDLKYIVMCQLGGTKVESNFRDTIHSTRNARVRTKQAADRPIKREERPTVERRTNAEVDRE